MGSVGETSRYGDSVDRDRLEATDIDPHVEPSFNRLFQYQLNKKNVVLELDRLYYVARKMLVFG